MLELLLLMTITQISEPVIECPAGCYPHTDKDLWKVWFLVENFDPRIQNSIFVNYKDHSDTLPVFTTASEPINFKFTFRWLE